MSQTKYFRHSGIISDTVSVTDNGIFETLGSKISNETPKGVACVRTT